MILSTKLLNLLGILAFGSFCLELAVANDDLDDTLKQALFLVKLLKSDFAHILRSNDDDTANYTEDENSTCSLPSEEFNSTMAMNDTKVTDSPAKSRGKFRRFDNEPTDDLGNIPATSQAQTTSSLSSATSEATTLHVEETAASTSVPTTLAQPSTSILPTTEQAILRTTTSANRIILTTADSAKQSIPADNTKQTILPTIAKSILLTATSTKLYNLPTTEEPKIPTLILSTLTTKHRKRVGRRTRVPVSKATTTVISNRNENHLNVSRHHLRHHTHHITTTEKWTKADIEMSQFASELQNELEGTNTEDVHIVNATYKDSKHNKLKKHRKTTTTMKIFLQGSSRIPIPFPENNGFCHFHPENALCGAN